MFFCHDRYSLLSSERKNNTIVSTSARTRWGTKRERREKAHRLHHDRICHATFAPSCCLRYYYPPSRAGFVRKVVEQEAGPTAFPAQNNSAPMPDERHARDGSKNGYICFTV